MTTTDLHALARLGAQTRLAELQAEAAAIRATYPDLVAPRARRQGRLCKAEGRNAVKPARCR